MIIENVATIMYLYHEHVSELVIFVPFWGVLTLQIYIYIYEFNMVCGLLFMKDPSVGFLTDNTMTFSPCLLLLPISIYKTQ